MGQGLVHCYLRARNMSDKAAANFEAIGSAIKDVAK
jgi:hypothetical protein